MSLSWDMIKAGGNSLATTLALAAAAWSSIALVAVTSLLTPDAAGQILPGAVNPPVITSPNSAFGTENQFFSYQITATNNPTSFGASSLPSGLSINAGTGFISGTPATTGTFTVTISATNTGGSGNRALTIDISPTQTPSPVITSAGMASGTVNQTFNYQITATNNPTTYGASGLPSGLSVNPSTGLISGAPTISGSFTANVTATNAGGTGSLAVEITLVTPSGLGLTGVKSRKTHSTAGIFDAVIDYTLPLASVVSVEPRVIGPGHVIVFQFNNPISLAGNVSVTDAASAMVGSAAAAITGNDVIVTLTGIPDNKRVTVTLTNVNGNATPFTASLGFLVGDVNDTRAVNSSDISGVKARSGQATNAANFRFDVNASGAISASDISAVKARSGLALP